MLISYFTFRSGLLGPKNQNICFARVQNIIESVPDRLKQYFDRLSLSKLVVISFASKQKNAFKICKLDNKASSHTLEEEKERIV
jgi:hypothetical protein